MALTIGQVPEAVGWEPMAQGGGQEVKGAWHSVIPTEIDDIEGTMVPYLLTEPASLIWLRSVLAAAVTLSSAMEQGVRAQAEVPTAEALNSDQTGGAVAAVVPHLLQPLLWCLRAVLYHGNAAKAHPEVATQLVREMVLLVGKAVALAPQSELLADVASWDDFLSLFHACTSHLEAAGSSEWGHTSQGKEALQQATADVLSTRAALSLVVSTPGDSTASSAPSGTTSFSTVLARLKQLGDGSGKVGCANPLCTNLVGPRERELKLKECSGCRAVTYCSKECSVEAWAGHKAACKQAALHEKSGKGRR